MNIETWLEMNEFEFTEMEYYRTYERYNREALTDEEWSAYCIGMLEHLMNLNKKVLDNLKNI